jgi:hypothetical protein
MLKKHLSLKVIGFILLLIGVSSFFVIDRYAYKHTIQPIDISSLPLIQREEQDYKTKPNIPGGLVVSNQDKNIYKGLRFANEIDRDVKIVNLDENLNIENILNDFEGDDNMLDFPDNELLNDFEGLAHEMVENDSVEKGAIVKNKKDTEPNMGKIKSRKQVFDLLLQN